MSRYNQSGNVHSQVINNLLTRVSALESRVAYLESKAYKPPKPRSRSRSRKRYQPRDREQNPSTSRDMVVRTQMEQLGIQPTPVYIHEANQNNFNSSMIRTMALYHWPQLVSARKYLQGRNRESSSLSRKMETNDKFFWLSSKSK